MRKIETLPSGRFKVRFRLDGKQSSETFDRKRDATQFAKMLDALGPQGAIDQMYAGEQEAKTPTLDEIAAAHFAHLPNVEPGTRMNYERLWSRTWSPLIGGLRADKVTKDAVKRAVIELGSHYSAKSLKNQRGLLSGVCQRAVEEGWLKLNPAKGVPLPRGKEHERVEMRILTQAEMEDLVARIHPHYRAFVMFLIGTGCRWGEAVAMQVQDVAPPNVRIRRALKWSPDNKRTVGATKTRKSNRTIQLPQQVLDLLDLDRPGDELVFTAPKGGPIHHRTFWSDVWMPAVFDLKPRPRIHDLRHTHASWLLAQGVPIHIVQARLGHESIQTTVDTYSHLMPDAQQMAASAAALVFTPRPPALGSADE